LVAPAHRDRDVGLSGELLRQKSWFAEVDVQFAHRLDHLGVDMLCGRGPGGEGGVSASGGPGEPRLAHLGSPGVVQANEQDGAHRQARV
jgi:hypothetical protein